MSAIHDVLVRPVSQEPFRILGNLNASLSCYGIDPFEVDVVEYALKPARLDMYSSREGMTYLALTTCYGKRHFLFPLLPDTEELAVGIASWRCGLVDKLPVGVYVGMREEDYVAAREAARKSMVVGVSGAELDDLERRYLALVQAAAEYQAVAQRIRRELDGGVLADLDKVTASPARRPYPRYHVQVKPEPQQREEGDGSPDTQLPFAFFENEGPTATAPPGTTPFV